VHHSFLGVASTRRPARKPDGRPGPPPRYPKDPAKYADPANWKYPVHTAFHARAARRYFNDPRNRAKYSEPEQAYVDKKIDVALKRLGVAVKITAGTVEAEGETLREDIPSKKAIEAMGREDLLRLFLGGLRFKSALGLNYSLVSFQENRSGRLEAKVKQYHVTIDFTQRFIAHDCADWATGRARGRLLCKHLGRLFLNLREDRAVPMLRQLLLEREAWDFRVG